MKNCKNCGAAAPPSSSQHSYVCEYCNTKNVDEEYFKEVAKTSDVGKSDRYAQLGINAYTSDEFATAEKHFESSVLENDKNAQVWLYLALCKSSLITASNFDKNIKGISDSLKRAEEIDSTSEIISAGRIAIFEKLVSRVSSISNYFFQTGQDTFIALGKSKDAANSATQEIETGINRISTLFNYKIQDSYSYVNLLINGLGHCVLYEQRGATTKSLIESREKIEGELIEIINVNSELIKRCLQDSGAMGSLATKKLSNLKPEIISAPPQEEKKGFFGKLFS